MKEFDPVRHIVGSSAILEDDGTWPSFYESEVYSFKFWRGDLRPEDNVYIAPVIETSFELATHEFPYVVDLKFHDCDSIEMSYFNHQNVIEELTFSFEDRGFYADGVTPLPPYICVKIGTPNHTVALTFKCFKVEVIGRREIQGRHMPNPSFKRDA
ncbi:hypothetical protein HX099_08380 [Thiopseudomonas alkaliphila]|uniref:Immunity protein 50 of polymorphic toxin system n=1 Tax=Thiopseudomonas alkaliphila TaxID=1697053 RepID=A0AAW7DW84_9GAMM|nr:Imm50 family immunity protein [Thiopseudomonas alkaliphila]MDM1696672.1 hypothetical protein [Thiopseudomonas alkaliphila]